MFEIYRVHYYLLLGLVWFCQDVILQSANRYSTGQDQTGPLNKFKKILKN